jgi:hypothetical protein
MKNIKVGDIIKFKSKDDDVFDSGCDWHHQIPMIVKGINIGHKLFIVDYDFVFQHQTMNSVHFDFIIKDEELTLRKRRKEKLKRIL